MTKYALTLVGLLGALALTAFGCSSGDNGNNTPDANTAGGGDGGGGGADANTNGTADAGSAALMGLGQICNKMTACGTDAPDCLAAPNATNGFCSNVCAPQQTVTTNDQKKFPAAPAGSDDACTATYMSSIGTPSCIFVVGGPAMPAANTEYTVDYYCGILCAQTAPMCPDGLTCQGGACLP